MKVRYANKQERRVASATERVKQEARKSHIVVHKPETQPLDTVEAADTDIPF